MKTLAQMGEAARRCSNVDYRSAMFQAIGSTHSALSALYADPTQRHLIAVNCAWAHAARIYGSMPSEADPTPTSGSTEPARLAA